MSASTESDLHLVIRQQRRLMNIRAALLSMALGTWGRDLTEEKRDHYRHRYGLRYVELLRQHEASSGRYAASTSGAEITHLSNLYLPHVRQQIALALHERSGDDSVGTVTLPDALRMVELVLDTVIRRVPPGRR